MAVPIPNPADTQLSTAALRYFFFYSISFFSRLQSLHHLLLLIISSDNICLNKSGT